MKTVANNHRHPRTGGWLKLTPEHYLDCSRMRIQTARILHVGQRYSAAIYFAGVAVESILRAYIVRENPEFDERHDLSQLYKTSQLEQFVDPKDRRVTNANLGHVWTHWKNDYRYASDDRLRAEFKRLALDRKIKDDFLKENSRRCVEAAFQIYTIGERRWKSKKN